MLIILMIAAMLTLIPAKMTWMLLISAAVFGFAYGTCAESQSPLVADLLGYGFARLNSNED